MKYLLSTLLLGLAARPAPAAAPPAVPATLDVAGLHLTLDEDAQRLIQLKVNSLCRHQPSLDARVALAEAAFPVIDRVLAEEGVPADFRYLVLTESALRGDAVSVHGAVGYWQLKAETARELGLTVNEQVDERQHLTASTRAAARYLVRHQTRTHNWAHALLCYNLGAGGARPYLDPAEADAEAMRFTARTSPYLLDFVAQKLVFEPACASGAVPFVPWREVPAAPGRSLPELAAALGADPAAVTRLNSWLLAGAVPQDGRPYTLLVPLAADVATAPGATPAPPAGPLAPDDPELVAIQNLPTEVPGPPERELPAARPSLPADAEASPASRPRPVTVAHSSGGPAPASAPALAPAAPVAAAPAGGTYVVAPGETLYALARRQGVRPAELAAWNNLPPDAGLRAGQVLRLTPPAPGGAAPTTPAPGSGAYVVAAGDTFYSIARRYKCSVEALRAHNERPDLTLHVGERLNVPL